MNCPACAAEIRAPLPRVGPGTTLGNFLIEKKLGSGGMGDVFLARQLSMDRYVALKVLPQNLTRKPHVVERFRHEVRMSARLEHPHLVTAFEAGEDFGYHYLAVSYVDGTDLRHRLKQEGAVPEKEALRYARHVAEALCYAWNNFRMLHRDVKPANIMVDARGSARLMDLGISKSLLEGDAGDSDLTVSGMLVGTPHYMSPEQAASAADVDCRSDIYSLGATLYHMLTGTTPYAGKGTVEVLRQIGLEPVTPVRERNSAVSEPCARLVAKMMALDREQRHPRWESVITDIERVLVGRDPLLTLGEGVLPVKGPLTPGEREAAKGPPMAVEEAAAKGLPGDTSAGEVKTPPRIDMRRRRVAWLTRHYLRRLMWLLGIAVVLVGSGLALRLTGVDEALLSKLLEWLESPSDPSLPIRPGPVAPAGESAAPVGVPSGAETGVESGGVPSAREAAAADVPAATSVSRAPVEGSPPPAAAADMSRLAARLDAVAQRRLGEVLDHAGEELLRGRPENAAAAFKRAAREEGLGPLVSELFRAAAVASEGGREQELLEGSLTEDLGKVLNLVLKGETLRVRPQRLERGVLVAVRLHPAGDTPLGQIRIAVDELGIEERLARLRRYRERPYGNLILALALHREGRHQDALAASRHLPPLLAEALARKLAPGTPAQP
ncbi:MAG: protein kinase [Lentisphaeria bacterium]|nr:protein kinase [Lentisphaeria bacterium]